MNQLLSIGFGGMFKDYDVHDLRKVGVLTTRIEDTNASVVFELLAAEIRHGSSEKDWRKVSSKETPNGLYRNPTLPWREERRWSGLNRPLDNCEKK